MPDNSLNGELGTHGINLNIESDRPFQAEAIKISILCMPTVPDSDKSSAQLPNFGLIHRNYILPITYNLCVLFVRVCVCV